MDPDAVAGGQRAPNTGAVPYPEVGADLRVICIEISSQPHGLFFYFQEQRARAVWVVRVDRAYGP
eukprot:4947354-Lingulodinium_polyedra.AAC.1